MKKEIIITVLSCSFLSSCYLEDTELPFIGYEYFPVELGRFVEYRVDSLWQDDPIGQIGSGEIHYLLRDVNESNFTDEENREAVRIERYWRQDVQENWTVKDIWHRVSTSELAEQNEENVIFIKHNFPVKEAKTWNGNARNTLQSLQELYVQQSIPEVWEYIYQNVHEPYSINGFDFDSTVTVMQLDRPAIFGLNVFAQEVYAKDIGLIHKQLMIYDIQQNPNSPTDKDTVGFTFEMVVTDFGQ